MNDAKNDIKKKLFDEKQYSTLVVGIETENIKTSAKQAKQSLIEVLGNKQQPELKIEALKVLKNNPKGLDLLMDAIDNTTNAEERALLIAACWESGIDCKAELSFFTDIAIKDQDYATIMETITVVDGIEPPVERAIVDAEVIKIKNAITLNPSSEKSVLLEHMLSCLELMKK